MIFETHAHYDDEIYDEDRDELLKEVHENGVDIIVNVGANLDGCKDSIALSEKYDFVYATVGIHPSEIKDLNEESFAWIKEQCRQEKVVAVGEIGLDYYWDKEEDVQAAQREWFKRQLDLAEEEKMPVIIHSRDAAEDTYSIMKEHEFKLECPGVVHCFSYDTDYAKKFVEMGFLIGVGGASTFNKNADLREMIAAIPLEKIVLETDAPYLTPTPFRGKRNRSDYIKYVAETVASAKGISVEEVYQQTTRNAHCLYPKAK